MATVIMSIATKQWRKRKLKTLEDTLCLQNANLSPMLNFWLDFGNSS